MKCCLLVLGMSSVLHSYDHHTVGLCCIVRTTMFIAFGCFVEDSRSQEEDSHRCLCLSGSVGVVEIKG
jgi:hypothetical protein